MPVTGPDQRSGQAGGRARAESGVVGLSVSVVGSDCYEYGAGGEVETVRCKFGWDT